MFIFLYFGSDNDGGGGGGDGGDEGNRRYGSIEAKNKHKD